MSARDLADEVRRIVEGLRPKPRLRFDKVAIRFISDLQSALQDDVPEGRTLIVTITAPIRQASKTAAALEEKIRSVRRSRSARVDLKAKIQGNQIRVRLVNGAAKGSAKVIGFVHNPESNPDVLFETTRSLILTSARA